MPNDDQPQGTDPMEQEDALPGDKPEEGSLQDTPQLPPSGEKKDPLDEIEDPTVLRTEAKKYRSIAQRKSQDKKPSEARPTPTPAEDSPSDVVTKRDFYRMNSQAAVKAAKAADAEVEANWSDIQKHYVNRRGQDTPDAITEDIRDAVTLWKSRKPADKAADPAKDLQTTPAQRPSSSRPAPQDTGRKTQSLRPKAQPMKEWYGTKSA